MENETSEMMINIGLSQKEAEERLKHYGPNVLKAAKKKPLILQFFEEFADLMVIILIIAALISLFEGEKKDTAVILFIVILNAIIGFTQKFKAEKALEALKKLLTPKARVIRDSVEQMIDAKDLVPDDVIILNEGDKIPADAKIFEVHELYVDESSLTGESIPVKRNKPHEKVFMGTQVTRGFAKAVATATGMNTEFGKIARLTTETKKEKSPLQKELIDIGKYVGKIALGISIALIAIGLLIQHKEFLETLRFAAAIAVAAVPEGLPATITIALAIGVQHLVRKNAIVKQLASVETLGSTTTICTDKTGTLTKNELTVREAILGSYHINIHGVGYEPKGLLHIRDEKTLRCFSLGEKSKFGEYECSQNSLVTLRNKNQSLYSQLEKLCEIAGLCNNARLTESEAEYAKKITVLGDPTEGALITFIEKAGFCHNDLLKKWKKIFEIPFDSERKRMTAVYCNPETKKVFAFTKGALEMLLPLTKNYYTGDKIAPLTDEMKKVLNEKNADLANRALRVMAFAFKEISPEIQEYYKEDEIEKDLNIVGLIGMIDPPREEVKDAVKLTKKAGIKIYIITGDYGLTAHAIAKELGITGTYNVKIITGVELDKISDKKLLNIFKEHNEIIFARISPSHKLRIVSVLKEKGEIVAVTGDGVNDAPALKKADIGISMGITGTDVSKEAANMVLADDSFSTIISAIHEGRVIYENLKKFIFYIFSSNIGELVVIFAAIAANLPAPLTAILILCVNVGTDVLPAIALGVDPPESDIMDKSPRDPNERILNRRFTYRYLFIGFWVGILVLGGYILVLLKGGYRFGQALPVDSPLYLEASTFAFVLLVMIQMANTFNARSDHQSVFRIGFLSNMKLVGAIVLSILLTAVFTQIKELNSILNVTQLNLTDWGLIILFSLVIILVEEIRKLFLKKRSKFFF